MRWSQLISVFFFFNDTATTEIYTLSLHDALPICRHHQHEGHDIVGRNQLRAHGQEGQHHRADVGRGAGEQVVREHEHAHQDGRSEEHTSELQSHSDLVCRLLLEKKKNCTYE